MKQDTTPTAHPSGLPTEQIAELRRLASAAAEHAYSPYSKFRVGAALMLDDGSIYTGCNLKTHPTV